ncbi:MAG: helix-turn-helix domain-containing protein [Clostridium sp.]|uniref:helix-turn-helix domain-containing protein n=1 Tax=Clostridium sp. TaxID=1506 RepID=UPI003F33796F
MYECKISLKNIKKVRKLKKMSQLELAHRTELTQSTISKLENDIRDNDTPTPRLETIEKIARALGVCTFDIMTCNKNNCKRNCETCVRKRTISKINSDTKCCK